MHLVGTDIVNVDNEDGLVGIQVVGELLEVKGLVFSLRHVDDYCSRTFLKNYLRLISISIHDGWMDA